MKRPLGIVALLYTGGLLLAEFLQPPLPALFSAAVALAAAAILLPKLRPVLIWPLVVLTGWTNLVWRSAVVSPNDLRAWLGEKPALVTVRGTLCETPGVKIYFRGEREFLRTQTRLNVNSIQRGDAWKPAAGRIIAVTTGALPENFFAGQQVEIFGVIAPPAPPLADGLFDYKTFLRRQEIYYELKAEASNDWRLVSGKTSPPLSDRFRVWARRALALGLPREDESLRLEYALTLGDRSVLTEDVAEPFVRAATYHIFAVDGLRMAIIFGIFFALFRVLRLPREICGLALVPLIWFYVALTGWPASAIRAAVMLTVVIAGWALKRPGDLLNSLFAAALIILIWDPQQLFQAGFQLSFFVVLCIALVMPALDKFAQWMIRADPLLPDELQPRWQRMLRVPLRAALGFLMVSLAAWLGSIPLVAYYFHIVTPVSAPANLLAVPLCALVLTSNLISLLLAGWLPAGAEIFNHAGWFLMECIRLTSHWFARWPRAYFYVSGPRLFTIGLYYFILLAAFTGWLFKANWRALKFAVLGLLALVWCAQWRRDNASARLTVLPLNGGSAVFCDAPGWKNDLLVDCGSESSVQLVTKPFLRGQGVNSLPTFAMTCGEARQIGGAALIQTNFAVGQIAASPVKFRSPAYRQVISAAENNRGNWRKVSRGDCLGQWTVFHPNGNDHFAQAGDNALVLRGEFSGARVLLLPALEQSGQVALVQRNGELRADIVVAGLPKDGEPLRDALLDSIQPKLIVIADSEFPANCRAGDALRQRFKRRGVPVVFTREAGAMKIVLRPSGWSASGMNGFLFESKK